MKAIFQDFEGRAGQNGLDFEQAFACIERIAHELGEPRLSKEQFKNCFPALDFDGDEVVTLGEMTNFVMDHLER